jgi:hypothetical protein
MLQTACSMPLAARLGDKPLFGPDPTHSADAFFGVGYFYF